MPETFRVVVGSADWEKAIRGFTDRLDLDFWDRFTPVTPSEIDHIERELNRILPFDFRSFLLTFGVGDFPIKFGGGFFTPSEIIEGCAGPILMLLGSAAWAASEEQRRYYITRGRDNPNLTKFTPSITRYAGGDLFDFVQVGYDGMSCYYQLICPNRAENDSGFCRITPEGTIEDRTSSFSEALWLMLERFHVLLAES